MRSVPIDFLLALVTAAALSACGTPDKRLDCGGPGQCPAGFYCAAENVCWPDAAAPVVSGVTATCGPPCPRDGAVRVTVSATDESRLGAARVRLDLDPSRAVPLARTATGWSGDVPLAGFPFPAFERAVAVTVEAEDEAGNRVTRVAPAVPVTRVKWVYDGVGTDGAVAVYADGSVLTAGDATDLLLRIGSDGSKVWGLSPGTRTLGTPAIGASAAWVGNVVGDVFAISDSGAVLNGAGCATGGSAVVPPAVGGAGDIAVVASPASKLFAVDGAGRCESSGLVDPFTASPVVLTDASIMASATASRAQLHNFSLSAAGFRQNWTGSPPPPDLGLSLSAPLAIDAQSRVWSVSTDGKVNVTTTAGATSTATTIGGGATGPVVLSDGSLVVGDASGTLHRITPEGAAAWPNPPSLGGTPQTPLVLAGGDALLAVPTSAGKLVALRADGTEAWSGQVVPGNGALRAGNIHTPAGAGLSLGYFPAANGKLYAVVLDGRLDAAAPWPKAFHDPRNTGNAATPIP